MAVRIRGQKSLSTDTITHSFRNIVLQIDHLRRGRIIRRSEMQGRDIVHRLKNHRIICLWHIHIKQYAWINTILHI